MIADLVRGADGQYTLYEDDGISQEYLQKRGTFTRMTWNDGARQLTIEPGAPPGYTQVAGPSRTFRVEVLPEGATRTVTYAGRRVVVGGF